MARRPKTSGDTVAAEFARPGTQAGYALMAHLGGLLPSLNRTERLIADAVIADPERVISSSISEFKVACGASVGSIVGFCHRLGLEGFADFKIALARDLAQSGFSAADDRPGESLLEQVFKFHAQSLIETLRVNGQTDFDKVAKALRGAKRIEFFSVGLSYPVAYTAYCKFLLIGLPASAAFDTHIQVIHATQLGPGDVAFGISCSGATQETAHCLEVARAKGATTICLTNAMRSPITSFSDLCLFATPSEIKYFQAPLASRITQLAVIDALFVTLAQGDRNQTAARLQDSGEELLKRRFDKDA